MKPVTNITVRKDPPWGVPLTLKGDSGRAGMIYRILGVKRACGRCESRNINGCSLDSVQFITELWAGTSGWLPAQYGCMIGFETPSPEHVRKLGIPTERSQE